jgi:hypothetical protein
MRFTVQELLGPAVLTDRSSHAVQCAGEEDPVSGSQFRNSGVVGHERLGLSNWSVKCGVGRSTLRIPPVQTFEGADVVGAENLNHPGHSNLDHRGGSPSGTWNFSAGS